MNKQGQIEQNYEQYTEKINSIESNIGYLAERINTIGLKQDRQNNEVLDNFIKSIDKLGSKVEKISDDYQARLEKKDFKEWMENYTKEFIKKTYGVLPQTIEIKTENTTKQIQGLTNAIFDKTLKLVNMNVPVMLVGGAGCGKNFMCEQIADALDMNFYYSSTISQEYKLTGFIDAGGNYHATELRKAMEDEKGGLFMLDEIDASVPETLVIINSVLANGYFDFPDKRVQANPKFRVICAGNTCGNGADEVYTGRNVIDGATLDRFVLLKMDYDKRIEEALCPDNDLRNFIWEVRNVVQKEKINFVVGTRTLKYASMMLENGFDQQEIMKNAIIKGMCIDDYNMIKENMHNDNNNYWFRIFKDLTF